MPLTTTASWSFTALHVSMCGVRGYGCHGDSPRRHRRRHGHQWSPGGGGI